MPKKKLQLSTEVAHLPENKTKNRYRDILPCKCNEGQNLEQPKEVHLQLVDLQFAGKTENAW